MSQLQTILSSLIFVIFFSPPLAWAKVCDSKSDGPNQQGCEPTQATSAQGIDTSYAQAALLTFDPSGYYDKRFSAPGDDNTTPFTSLREEDSSKNSSARKKGPKSSE